MLNSNSFLNANGSITLVWTFKKTNPPQNAGTFTNKKNSDVSRILIGATVYILIVISQYPVSHTKLLLFLFPSPYEPG